MAQSGALKLALLAGFCLLVGLHLPSPWRSSWPAPVDPQWERGKMAAPEGGCSCSSGAEDCCPGKHKHDKGHKVQVDVYGESLCPDTSHAIHDVVGPMFSNGLSDNVKLHYYAYGKVSETAGGLSCQHGPLECKINRWLNCAQELHPGNQSDWFAYVSCVHGNGQGSIEGAASDTCIQQRGWDKEEMSSCASGQLGDQLEKRAQEATKGLGYRLTFVPWILVNGIPLGRDFETLPRYVCAALPGDRPKACSEF